MELDLKSQSVRKALRLSLYIGLPGFWVVMIAAPPPTPIFTIWIIPTIVWIDIVPLIPTFMATEEIPLLYIPTLIGSHVAFWVPIAYGIDRFWIRRKWRNV